jgi:8-oxo-dGTP pyrophosphatase MutT (NUDIX family)
MTPYLRNNCDYHPFMDDTNESYGCLVLDCFDRILIVKGTEKLSLPKGHRKRAETQIDCVIREVYEETGLDISEFNLGKSYRFSRCSYYCVKINKSFDSCNLQSKEYQSNVFWIPLYAIGYFDNNVVNIDLRYCIKNIMKIHSLANKNLQTLLLNKD